MISSILDLFPNVVSFNNEILSLQLQHYYLFDLIVNNYTVSTFILSQLICSCILYQYTLTILHPDPSSCIPSLLSAIRMHNLDSTIRICSLLMLASMLLHLTIRKFQKTVTIGLDCHHCGVWEGYLFDTSNRDGLDGSIRK